MLYCDKCKVNIVSYSKSCPLCRAPLHEEEGAASEQAFPDFAAPNPRSRWITLVISLAAISAILVVVLINILTWNSKLWSVIAAVYIVYAWLLGRLTFKAGVALGKKLFAHALAVPVTLIVVNVFSKRNEIWGKISWAVSYATPLILVGFILATAFINYNNRRSRKDFIFYQLTLCILAFVPLLLVLFKVVEPMIPSIIAAVVSFITLIGLVVFGRRSFKSEFNKKFHI